MSGVLDHILGEDSIESYIVKEGDPNLDVLPSGGKAKNPTAILNNTKFVMLLGLRDSYDKIIIDSENLRR